MSAAEPGSPPPSLPVTGPAGCRRHGRQTAPAGAAGSRGASPAVPPAPRRRHLPARRAHTRSHTLAHARRRAPLLPHSRCRPAERSPRLLSPGRSPGGATLVQTATRGGDRGALTSSREREPGRRSGAPPAPSSSVRGGQPLSDQDATAQDPRPAPAAASAGAGEARARDSAPFRRAVTTATRAHAPLARGGPRSLPSWVLPGARDLAEGFCEGGRSVGPPPLLRGPLPFVAMILDGLGDEPPFICPGQSGSRKPRAHHLG